jgi:hypothetical protein
MTQYPLLYLLLRKEYAMFKIRQFALLTFASLALAISVGIAGAQPDGTRLSGEQVRMLLQRVIGALS